MPVRYRRRCGLAGLLCLALGLSAAQAQNEPAAKPWTGPPSREAPAPKVLAPKPAAISPAPAPTAAADASRRATDTKPERKPRPKVAQARQKPKIVDRRQATSRPRVVAETRRFERPERVRGDERLRRIEAAREAGFLVVRSRTIELPDGRRLQSYQPYDEEEEED